MRRGGGEKVGEGAGRLGADSGWLLCSTVYEVNVALSHIPLRDIIRVAIFAVSTMSGQAEVGTKFCSAAGGEEGRGNGGSSRDHATVSDGVKRPHIHDGFLHRKRVTILAWK